MSFTFPDPSVQDTVTNSDNGITYKYADGMWSPISDDAEAAALQELEDEVVNNDTELDALRDSTNVDRTLLLNVNNRVSANENLIASLQGLDLDSALSALALAQQDIIDLKSKVNTLELTSFLILE